MSDFPDFRMCRVKAKHTLQPTPHPAADSRERSHDVPQTERAGGGTLAAATGALRFIIFAMWHWKHPGDWQFSSCVKARPIRARLLPLVVVAGDVDSQLELDFPTDDVDFQLELDFPTGEVDFPTGELDCVDTDVGGPMVTLEPRSVTFAAFIGVSPSAGRPRLAGVAGGPSSNSKSNRSIVPKASSGRAPLMCKKLALKS